VGKRRKVRLVGVRVRVTEAVALFKLLEWEARRLARAELSRVVVVFQARSPRYARRGTRRYLLHFMEGVVDGFAASLLRERRGDGGGASPPVDWSGVAAGEVVRVEIPRVEGLVKVETRAGGAGLREKLVSSGAREVSGQGDDTEEFDELDEVAYRSGFRQATGVRVPGGGGATENATD